MAALASFHGEPVAAAESAYLALAAGVVLLAAAAVAPRPGLEVAAGALLATLATWALPEGPARGAVVIGLAAASLALAAARRFATAATPANRTVPPGLAPVPTLSAVPTLGLALGLQALLRGGELLAPGSPLRGVALFVAFPAVGALAVLAIARWHGRRPALLAGAAALLLAPGFRPASIAALVVLAAAPWLLGSAPLAGPWTRALASRVERRLGPRGPTLCVAAIRTAAAVLLLVPFAWDPRAAGVALAAGVAGAAAAATGARRWLGPAAAALALGLFVLLPGRSPAEAAPLAALAVLAVPAVGLAWIGSRGAPGRSLVPAALAALLLAVAAARGVLVEGALVAPAALAALAVPRRGPLGRSIRAVQSAWSSVALGLAALLGAYPWLRSDPLAEVLARFGLRPGLPSALVAVLAVAALAALGPALARARLRVDAGDEVHGRRWRAETIAARAAAAALVLLAFLHLPPAGAAWFAERDLVLDAAQPGWTGRGSGPGSAAQAGTLVIDSALANSAALPAGTPVATVRLRDGSGGSSAWVLRTGIDTGEWAVDRPDLRPANLPVPEPWLSWVAGEGGFFGRRYRAVHRVAAVGHPVGIDLELRADLPPDVSLTVYHLELRP